MTYFDCFVVGSWMFAMGWFLGAVYMQNHAEETEEIESPRASEKLEKCTECEAWRVLSTASAAAD